MLCPCGSNKLLSTCCEPIINLTQVASCSEQLMRSRYTAYALKNYQYIYNTYAEKVRHSQSITDIKSWCNATKWLRLEVHPLEAAHKDKVSFTAYYLYEKGFYKMSEISLFIQEKQEWRYHSGDVFGEDRLPYPSHNDLCPCLSQKKFKKCCG